MTAEVLRKAAALMRERAEAATPGPWTAFRARATNPLDHAPVIGVTRDLAVDYDTDLFATQKCKAEDATHIASWHPAVALAVADWIDGLVERHTRPISGEVVGMWGAEVDAALAVARAYLGESS